MRRHTLLGRAYGQMSPIHRPPDTIILIELDSCFY